MSNSRQVLSTATNILREVHTNLIENVRNRMMGDVVLPSYRTLAKDIVSESGLYTFTDVKLRGRDVGRVE